MRTNAHVKMFIVTLQSYTRKNLEQNLLSECSIITNYLVDTIHKLGAVWLTFNKHLKSVRRQRASQLNALVEMIIISPFLETVMTYFLYIEILLDFPDKLESPGFKHWSRFFFLYRKHVIQLLSYVTEFV